MEKRILYFEETGPGNTGKLLSVAVKRANELGIKDVVVASSHGGTAIKAKEAFGDPKLNLVAVSICEGYRSEGWCMSEEEKDALKKKGIKMLTGIHALGDGVGSAFAEKHGGKPVEEVVRDTFYRFGQGMKVCVEIVLMAADAGLIQMDREVMAIAGTSEGADTCIVVEASVPEDILRPGDKGDSCKAQKPLLNILCDTRREEWDIMRRSGLASIRPCPPSLAL